MLVSIAKHAETSMGRGTDSKLEKRKAKVRSAWISFAGRIVAQILGAAATVGFALIVLHRAPVAQSEPIAAPVPVQRGSATVPTATAGPMVAVLPFQTYAATRDYDHIAGAMADLLVTQLATGSDLKVASATSAMRFHGGPATVPEIGRQLGVSHIVEGSVAISGGRARIVAQLIDAASDQHVWARSYETTVDDALALENRMAAEIARDVLNALARVRDGL
jgi:TolB-like protein